MRVAGLLIQYVFHHDISHQQRIPDERAVTTPWDGLGAHDDGALAFSQHDKLFDAGLELLRLHVIGKAAEG